MNTEEEKYLDLLSIFHYVVGAFVALFSCIPFIHFFIGLAVVSGVFGQSSDGSEMPMFFGWIFMLVGAMCILIGWSIAVCIILTGRKLKARRGWLFCVVVAGVECMFTPFGTVLGVLSLMLLTRDSVKQAFELPAAPEPSPAWFPSVPTEAKQESADQNN